MKKLNIAGGEPFLYPKFLGAMVQFCKKKPRLESVWLKRYGKHVDVLAVSCDSCNEQTSIKIGRGDGNNYNIKFKLNRFVCRLNYDEDMASSYLLIDEYMRFMDKGSGKMRESESILDVGVEKALSQVS
ncbi:hypothetical protein B0T25DRAFT_572058 [Lasiosphaeria hispida]|uniref:Uncharacterized protein n=1 Tax=Lasiosphaeria hispida TaxID=260671 RepID=A0AAJ0MB50_9PEZI|nr:hypothetical protein B0T25DRAFT_572058 [Lasiosphaeria hispida]